MTTEERFWSKVDKSGECWIWTANRSEGGYGRFRFRGAKQRAHRVSYILNVGEIPDGLCVLHNCPDGNNRACVNPAHLFLGTKKDNADDCAAKGRSSRGERHGNAKLNERIVSEIRTLRSQGLRWKEIADHFAIPVKSAQDIGSRRRWRHVQ